MIETITPTENAEPVANGTIPTASGYVLSEEILARCAERAPIYDRENRFFSEDFDELKAAKYLIMSVPQELGGLGLTLDEVCREQRRLAYYAAPTALAVNMHLYWIGLSADLWRAGDRSCEWILREAAGGAVFAAGHAESGNDMPLLWSTTEAERVEGGYRFTGRKSFGSLSPVWTYLGLHGIDTSDPSAPRIVHGFMPRYTEGYTIKRTWDNVLGMRATRSDDTVLNGAFVPDCYIPRIVAAGFAGIDAFVLGMFAWALLGFGNIYYGLAQRVLDLTIEKLQSKQSIGIGRKSMRYHPAIQNDIAEMVLELEGIGPHLDRIAEEWTRGVDYGPAWGAKIVAAKTHAVEGAWRVVDRGMEVAGGFGIFPASGLERLVRDARLGRIHPANTYFAREILAKTTLGINPDEQPRWG